VVGVVERATPTVYHTQGELMLNRLLILLGVRVGFIAITRCIVQAPGKDEMKIMTVGAATDGNVYELITWQGRNVWSQLPNINTDHINLPKAQP
jgi:hypothetical protein